MLYEISWINVQAMLADQPRYEAKGKPKKKKLSLEQFFQQEEKKKGKQ